MANIFNIQQELFDIFNQIEENEGELTPELEESLKITQDEFKDKIKAYTAVVKQLEVDLAAIKDEKARLDSLKKSKEKTIERLKNVMRDAIMYFGDTSKSGTKFIDYGTGKVSLRKSESIELDDDKLKTFTNRFISYCNWLRYQNTFDQGGFNLEDIRRYCNQGHGDDYDNDVIDVEFTIEDLSKIQADLDFRIDLTKVVSTEEGRNLMRALLEYNSVITAKPIIDKKAIKDEAKHDGVIPTFATYVVKQNVTIK